MTIGELLLLLLISGICGSLGQAIAGFSRGGCLVAIVLGFIGALLGSWLSRTLELPDLFSINLGDNIQFPVVWAVIGSTLFVALIGLLTRGRRE